VIANIRNLLSSETETTKGKEKKKEKKKKGGGKEEVLEERKRFACIWHKAHRHAEGGKVAG